MQNRYIIAAEKIWHPAIVESLKKKISGEFLLIRNANELTSAFLETFKPTYLFFLHWSSFIPSEIYEKYECVIFHMTDVPFGRGGSPLQNLIARGIYQTQLTALKCTQKIDAGPVYLKYPLSLLLGSAQEIFHRANLLIEEMIVKIIQENLNPLPQQGEPVYFDRRKPEEGDIAGLKDLNTLYDYIRMLDADGYPHAFFETEHFRFEFRRASSRSDEIIADVKITRKKHEKNSSDCCSS